MTKSVPSPQEQVAPTEIEPKVLIPEGSSEPHVPKKRSKKGEIPCLSAAEFRDCAREKGWTMIAVGRRWGLTKTRMSQVANSDERRIYFDDAIRGLPNLKAKSKKKAT